MTSILIQPANQSKLSDILLKKYLNVPASRLGQNQTLEIALTNRSYVINDTQLFSDPIPPVAPTDLSNDSTFPPTLGQSRKFSRSFTYIKKYEKFLLTPVGADDQYYYTFIAGSVTDSPKNNYLRYTIPYNYDPGTSYKIEVFIKGANNEERQMIQEGIYPWIIDVDSGILTFFNGLPKEYRVYISFWRYEGRFGFQSTSANAPKLAFDGGSPDTDFSKPGSVVVIDAAKP